MPSRFELPHIDISPLASSQPYQGLSTGGSSAVRVRNEHGRRLQAELLAALTLADLSKPVDERIDAASGVYLEVELRRGTKPDVLDAKRTDIRSSAAKVQDAGERTIALYVPDSSRPILEKILDDYLNGPLTEKGQNPPHQAKVEAVEAIRKARLETLWTDNPSALPDSPHAQMWWGLWCRPEHEEEIERLCARLDVRAASSDRRLYFPEITVIPVLAPRAAIELMLFGTGLIAELRRADDNPVFFTDELDGDQSSWTEDLAGRVVWPQSDAPRVCLLDTGMNRSHALLEPAAAPSDLHTLISDWGVDDHHADGHGTSMAGMALYGDLTAALSDQSERRLTHRLESVKVLPPDAFDPTEPHSYGVITQAAVAMPEITAPDATRVYCMAVTNENISGAAPSSWSAAVDQAAAAKMPGDDESSPKRLLVLSAGNIPPEIDFARILPQDDYPIEDPAQAWNALTIGGYTDLVDVKDRGYESWSPMAAAGALSPHSRTSTTWRQGNSPFKPELVLEAGNRAINPARTEVLTVNSLSLLSTGSDVGRAPLVSFQATSAAAAQGARMAAQLAAAHPDLWPETVRALMVHSAEWTEPMLAAFDGRQGKRDTYGLLRQFGYGVPNFERAAASANNHLALIAQVPIQPFRMKGGRKFNECHYYSLPIPRRMLEQLENEIVDLKVTLSYFIEPNPGLAASIDPQRYQSHGLRFDLRRKNETIDTFKKRVNASEREDVRIAPRTEPDDNRWLFGPQSISAGSLHSDIWSGPAIELLGRDTLCVKPVNGWWRNRSSAEVCDQKTRYSLVVSMKTRNGDLDIYTPIRIAVDQAISIETEVAEIFR